MRVATILFLAVGYAAAAEKAIDWKLGMTTSEQALTMSVSDTAKFTWGGGHNVWQSTDKAAYENCDLNKGTEVHSSAQGSPYIYTPSAPGVVYFICEARAMH